jgi:DNA-binding transcriptional LysR family regulator
MDRFSSMAIFARVVERGSFTAAAEGLDMTPTMVGNHIRELERRLNGRLLNRTTRRQSLTELGQRYHARCLEILALVDAAELDAREMQSSPRGRLRVSCPVIYGTRVIVPALAGYLDQYPEVQVELSLGDRFVDLAEEGFDAAIRVGVLPDSGLIARPLADSPRIACASPAYLARHGHPQAPADLAQHNCLAFMFTNGAEREWRFPRPDGNGVEHISVRGRQWRPGASRGRARGTGGHSSTAGDAAGRSGCGAARSSFSRLAGANLARPCGASARCAYAAEAGEFYCFSSGDVGAR